MVRIGNAVSKMAVLKALLLSECTNKSLNTCIFNPGLQIINTALFIDLFVYEYVMLASQKTWVWVTMVTPKCTMAWPVSVGGVGGRSRLGDLDSEELGKACWEMKAQRKWHAEKISCRHRACCSPEGRWAFFQTAQSFPIP